MPYRSASITCIRHPFTAASSACSVCGHEVCGECGTWLALRFRCLDCAARHRRWQRFRGRVGRVALMLPLIATLFGVGAMAMMRPTQRNLHPIAVRPYGDLSPDLPSVCRFGSDAMKKANGCYWREALDRDQIINPSSLVLRDVLKDRVVSDWCTVAHSPGITCDDLFGN